MTETFSEGFNGEEKDTEKINSGNSIFFFLMELISLRLIVIVLVYS